MCFHDSSDDVDHDASADDVMAIQRWWWGRRPISRDLSAAYLIIIAVSSFVNRYLHRCCICRPMSTAVSINLLLYTAASISAASAAPLPPSPSHFRLRGTGWPPRFHVADTAVKGKCIWLKSMYMGMDRVEDGDIGACLSLVNASHMPLLIYHSVCLRLCLRLSVSACVLLSASFALVVLRMSMCMCSKKCVLVSVCGCARFCLWVFVYIAWLCLCSKQCIRLTACMHYHQLHMFACKCMCLFICVVFTCLDCLGVLCECKWMY